MTPELDIVDVRRASFLVKRQQLVCAPVEAAHPGVCLRPHNEVERVKPGRDRSRMHGRIAPPIDEGADDAALGEMASGSLDPDLVEGQELVAAFPRSPSPSNAKHCSYSALGNEMRTAP